MDREFEAIVIDDKGHVDMPDDVRQRHGLKQGARVRIVERGDEVVIRSSQDSARKARSMHDMVGVLGKDPKSLNTLMEERRKDRAKEDGIQGS